MLKELLSRVLGRLGFESPLEPLSPDSPDLAIFKKTALELVTLEAEVEEDEELEDLESYLPKEVDLSDEIFSGYDIIDINCNGVPQTLVVLGDIWFKEDAYVVCMTPEDLVDADGEISFVTGQEKGETPITILQKIPGVNGNDFILYPVVEGPLHDSVYDTFVDQETWGSYDSFDVGDD